MSDLQRSLPHNSEAERAILGAIILDNRLMAEAHALLVPEQFYVPTHRRIFQAMENLAHLESEIAPALIGEHLEGGADSVGGISFLTNLTYGLPASSSIAHYAKVVREKAILRQVIKLTAKIQEQAMEGSDVEELISSAEAEFFTLGVQAHLSARSPVKTYNDVAGLVVNQFDEWGNGNIVAIPTGIPELDRKLANGGLSKQDFVIIAARSGFGKTAFANQIVVNAARSGVHVLIFSLEMSAERLFIRSLSSVSDVAHFQISPWTFQYNAALSGQIVAGIPKLQNLPIHIDDKTTSLRGMLAVSRDWKRKLGSRPGLIVIDYLQLADNKLERRTRQEEVAGISTEVKRLAKELDVPIIGVSQFSRSAAKENRRPELSDLRESGQLEQDADLVLFPWSEDGLKDVPVRAMKLYCPKQRSGLVGWEIPIDFDAEHQWFWTAEMYSGQGRLTA